MEEQIARIQSFRFSTRSIRSPDPSTLQMFCLTKNSEIFEMGDKWYENFLGKIPENPETVEFPKSEPFNRTLRKFQDESQMEREFPGQFFRKFGYTSRGCPPLRNLCKFSISYSALASSFGRDHRELDISRKNDGDAYSIKETFWNLSTCMSINTSYS